MKKAVYTVISTLSMFFAGSAMFAVNVLAQSYRYGTTYNNAYDSAAGGIFGIFGLLIWCVAFVVAVALYIFIALQVSKIYKKNGMTDKTVMAFIPFVSTYFLAKAADEPDNNAMLYAISPLLGFIPCIGGIAALAVMVMLWLKVAKKMNVEEIWAILTIIPIVNLYATYKIAEGKK